MSNTALVNEILGDHNVDKQMTDSRDDVGAIEANGLINILIVFLGGLPNG